jgi:hypothetical protein
MSEHMHKKPETAPDNEVKAAREIHAIVAGLAKPIERDPNDLNTPEVTKSGMYTLPQVSGPFLLTHVLAEERRIITSEIADEDILVSTLAFFDMSVAPDELVMELIAEGGDITVLANRQEYHNHDPRGLAKAQRMLDWVSQRYQFGYLTPVETAPAVNERNN